MNVGINLVSNLDFIALVVYTLVATLVIVYPNKALEPVDIIYIIGFYTRICKDVSDLTGLGIRYTLNALVSLKRIQVSI